MITKRLFFTIALALFTASLFSQVRTNDIFSGQAYSKDMTEYLAKEFIIRDVLNIPEQELIAIEIDAITASKSGELTTVVYSCPELNRKGLVFGFWSIANAQNQGYGFKHIDYNDAKELLDKLKDAIDDKKNILSNGSNWNAAYKWEDLYFMFYSSGVSNKIRVFWTGFDSEWNQSNLKTTMNRFKKFNK